ncbi:lysine 2,3-aminomutase [Streptomyces lincolnensis]|nr:lysine 2,3-aminomutase [Streptomyces lincolnensis]
MTLLLDSPAEASRFRAWGPRHLDRIAERFGMDPQLRESIRLAARVLPFRVNDYVLTRLIEWDRAPDDPMFQLVFPQSDMLRDNERHRLARLIAANASESVIRDAVAGIRAGLNPHPSGQQEFNVPSLDGRRLPGLQHKYRETVLYFPGQGQTCHSYCTYCFRWAQFIGDQDLRFATPGPDDLVAYLRRHPEVSDVLVTGGDPLVMSADRLRQHVEPLLGVPSVRTIRIGTKAVAYWPQRFVTDRDADTTLRLFEEVTSTGRQLAVMAHFSHPREIGTDLARTAVARIRSTGASLYCQAPLIAHVNDDAAVWAELWRAESAMGAVPYYLFVERDTGPHGYFRVPLSRAVDLFHDAYRRLPGLARTVRGPVMSATPGKVVVDGVQDEPTGRYFQLRLLQARDPALVGRPFRARYSPSAYWLTDLVLDPATPGDLVRALRVGGADVPGAERGVMTAHAQGEQR